MLLSNSSKTGKEWDGGVMGAPRKPRAGTKKASKARLDAKKVIPGQSILPEGYRPAKNSELAKGVMAVTLKPKKTRKRKKAVAPRAPKIGQAASLDGKVVRVNEDNLEEVTQAKLRKTLPTAGPDVMAPESPAPIEQVVLPPRLKASQNGKNIGGFAGKFEDVRDSVHAALGHLETMAANPKGTVEHHTAHEAFNVEHAKIGQIGNKGLHSLMALARNGVQKTHGTPQVNDVLKAARVGILGKLEEGRMAAKQRSARATAPKTPTEGQE